MIFRLAVRRDLPAVLALLQHEHEPVDPATVEVGEAHERAFAAVDEDPRNELVVLDDGTGTVLGCLQITYIPGLGAAAASGPCWRASASIRTIAARVWAAG